MSDNNLNMLFILSECIRICLLNMSVSTYFLLKLQQCFGWSKPESIQASVDCSKGGVLEFFMVSLVTVNL